MQNLSTYSLKLRKSLVIKQKKNFNEKKTVLFRSITGFWTLKKPRYLENRVVKELRKRRSACTYKCYNPIFLDSTVCIFEKYLWKSEQYVFLGKAVQ